MVIIAATFLVQVSLGEPVGLLLVGWRFILMGMMMNSR
jgi:hypothetical protein